MTEYILGALNKNKCQETYVTGEEVIQARETCIKLCQKQAFKEEIGIIKKRTAC